MFSKSDPGYNFYATANNINDLNTAGSKVNGGWANTDIYYQLYDESGSPIPIYDSNCAINPVPRVRPLRKADGTALYGDGYAIAGYHALHGPFQNLSDVKNALTYVERSSPPDGVPADPLE